MDKIWYRNPSKSEVIGRCGGDEKLNDNAEPTKSTLKKQNKKHYRQKPNAKKQNKKQKPLSSRSRCDYFAFTLVHIYSIIKLLYYGHHIPKILNCVIVSS